MPAQDLPGNSAISQGKTESIIEKAGEAFENLGKILQGQTGAMSMEELRSAIAELKDIDEEYFFGRLFEIFGEALRHRSKVLSNVIGK